MFLLGCYHGKTHDKSISDIFILQNNSNVLVLIDWLWHKPPRCAEEPQSCLSNNRWAGWRRAALPPRLGYIHWEARAPPSFPSLRSGGNTGQLRTLGYFLPLCSIRGLLPGDLQPAAFPKPRNLTLGQRSPRGDGKQLASCMTTRSARPGSVQMEQSDPPIIKKTRTFQNSIIFKLIFI